MNKPTDLSKIPEQEKLTEEELHKRLGRYVAPAGLYELNKLRPFVGTVTATSTDSSQAAGTKPCSTTRSVPPVSPTARGSRRHSSSTPIGRCSRRPIRGAQVTFR